MLSLIGKTPIIKLKNTINNHNLYAKCEWLNPTGSIKDRVAKYILENLIKNKKIKAQQAIIEASSGNMGTSLAAIGKLYKHPVYIACPEKTGQLKREMIKSFGANLTICKNTSDHTDPNFYVNKAKEIAKDIDGILINQYDNQLNTECHYKTTGQEIVNYFLTQSFNIDYFITVGGSGGTISGCAKKIKEIYPQTKVIMPDPKGSVYYDIFYNGAPIKENIHSYKVEGPGNPVFCKSMKLSYIDEIIQFSDDQAIQGCLDLSNEQGIYAGHSSGANYFVAKKLIEKLPQHKSYNILIMVLDSGMKYTF
ncbi:PLP-dependent cysteine synthase family protein [Francisella hispaniensis]|uniref:cysteine synthase n=1 Tax=Francisella hispaniensis FSC454 TaxID=1088883 RepID=A0AAC9NN82_9GAMM|nr:cysteine synthase family protein [Francisella hispaniensis]APD50245.1 cystathionine beta-synthase [Francisella hispaniensis FSC454]KYW83538.1 cystathionine beta-synthase [Francisella hispaniensis FSC454]